LHERRNEYCRKVSVEKNELIIENPKNNG